MTLFIWEYLVKPENLEEFLLAYGPRGTWVELFSHAEGYLRTELRRDTTNPNRFITIDYWSSATAKKKFTQQFSREYALLDVACAAFAEKETFLGHFNPAGEIDPDE